MSGTPYSYVPIRYVHDVISGESLNLGVLVYAPEAGILELKTDTRLARLSHAFANFDDDVHRIALQDLKKEIFRLYQTRCGPQLSIEGRPADAGLVMQSVWPDLGTQYTFGETAFGIADDPKKAAERLYRRLVASQAPTTTMAETEQDRDLWKKVAARPLRERGISSRLTPRTVQTPIGPIKFAHTVQGKRLNIVQALSFDLSSSEGITKKAEQWLGRLHNLAGVVDVGHIAILIGRPKAPARMGVYRAASEMLRGIKARQEIYDDTAVGEFVSKVASLTTEG
jgi:hypothetical protein